VSPPRVAAKPKAEIPMAKAVPSTRGDRAGEHLGMDRGRYSAWTHVVIAFALEALLLGVAPMLVIKGALGGAISTSTASGIGLVGGLFIAWLVFRDRWRCIEAFSSNFCSGVMNLSVLYVPVVALVYANVRGIGKLTRR
jgi:hypothetical protein